MHAPRRIVPVAAFFLAATLSSSSAQTIPSQSQARDEQLRWRVPLAEKADILARQARERHWIAGTYPSLVVITADGRPVDLATTGYANIAHTSSWTSCWLMAESLHLAWARAHGDTAEYRKALDTGGGLVNGLWTLAHVSGRPGYMARGIAQGHGPAYEEWMGRSNERNEWHQGAGPYREYRFRGNPSHHNYAEVVLGLTYRFWSLTKDNPRPTARERAQMDSIRTLMRLAIDYAYKSHDLVVLDLDGTPSAGIIFDTQDGVPSTRSLMATSALRWAFWVTGDSWCKRKHDELVRRYNYLGSMRTMRPDQWQNGHEPDWDDTGIALAVLWLVHEVEDDPTLKEFYRFAATQIFATKKAAKRSEYNYLYAAITGDRAGADLPGALETMRLYPTSTLITPMMNSIRTDIAFADGRDGKRAAEPLPFNDQPLDNEWDWKGDPYALDSWLSVPIAALAVSPEDPDVRMAADSSGILYRSNDGGRTWSRVEFGWRTGTGNARVRDVAFGARSRIIVLATDRGLFATQTGGYFNDWTRAEVGREIDVRQVLRDPANPHAFWAIATDGVWRSVDLGQEEAGGAWTHVSGPMPGARNVVYGLSPGATPRLWAVIDGRIYSHRLDADGWAVAARDVEAYHQIPAFHRIVGAAERPDRAFFLLTHRVWGRAWPIAMRSADGGKTYTIVGQRRPVDQDMPIPMEGSGLEGVALGDLAVDPENPDVVYGAAPTGVYRSIDGGTTWRQTNAGLRIPYAHRVFAPRELPGTIFAATPAGLVASPNRGDSWEPETLVLAGPEGALMAGPNRVERGGVGYLAAWWMGRCFGLISDAEATTPPPAR